MCLITNKNKKPNYKKQELKKIDLIFFYKKPRCKLI